MTTEKDAVRFPRLETTPVPIYYVRVEIKLLDGAENFHDAVEHICFRKGASKKAASAFATPTKGGRS
jgi:hypothetical protein